MTGSQHAREKEVFLGALERPEGERAAFLDRECGDDAELRRAVSELLEMDGDSFVLREPRGVTYPGRPPETPQALPDDLLWAGVKRLRLVAWVLQIALLVTWLVPVTFGGRLSAELQDVAQWGPPLGVIFASGVMLLLSHLLKAPRRILDVGLAYQVVVAYGLVGSQYLDAFADVPREAIDFDLVSFSPGAIWVVVYAALVPMRPLRALGPLLLSATAPPVIYALSVREGQAPQLEAGDYFWAFSFAHLAAVAAAMFVMSVVHGLGREVARAREVGSYRLEEPLGEGGMGQVWRARHRLLARPAAVKLIRTEALGGDGASRRLALERFEREAQATALLSSPNTVELYDFGQTADGSFYYVMELLDGIDLDELVRRFGPLPGARVVRLAAQACSSLAEAHAKDLVHRDVKPANLFVCRQGTDHDVLKVLDFGLVRALHHATGEATAPSLEGTPAFMAPETASGGARGVDARSDLYGLGCSMYWALTGRPPFDASTFHAMLAAHMTVDPVPPSEAGATDASAELDVLVLRCLAKDPEARVQSATELRRALLSLPEAAHWSEADAARWWSEHEPA